MPLRAAVLLGLIAGTCPPLDAQRRDAARPMPGPDPYTQGEPANMATAGYESFGPFRFGTNHGTTEIETLLPGEPLIWIETAHFRIGSALPPIPLAGQKAWIQQQRKELVRLAGRLPGLRADCKQLDAWLRAHLVAQRVEQLYAGVLADLRRSENDFPPAPGHDPRAPERFFGLGPYLGMQEKFTLLLLRKSASLAKYTAAHHAWATVKPTRFHDHRFGTAFFGAAIESDGGLLQEDEALCTHLTFHTAHNLYTSYRAYGHNLPAWLVTGLSHWHARRVSARFPVYDLRSGPGSAPQDYLAWDKRWPVMLRAREFEPLPRFLERMDAAAFTMDDHLQSWALVDWLMATRREQTMALLHQLKEPFHARLRFPTDGELFDRQRAALRARFGVDAAGLEELWRRNPGTRVASPDHAGRPSRAIRPER